MKCPKCHADNPDTQSFCGNCGTRLTPLADAEPSITKTIEKPKEELTTGATFAGRYQIIEELGKGGMGRVYKVVDKEVNAKIALKLVKPEISADKNTIERFRNELKTARDISHKNICRMYDLNKEEGSYYITMEFVPGEDLKSMIRMSGRLAMSTSISIAKQLCDGLTEAHRLGVVHRDLKPSNIMIDKDGNARIMDFGIARSLTAKGITGAGVMIGTPEYMSPEQAEGKNVDQRSDIYSLGIILYEMVTGRLPFEGESPIAVGMKHKGEIPRPPRELNAQVSDDLNRLILKCLEKDKENRYQKAGELFSELEDIEKGIPTTTQAATGKKPLTSREITITLGLKRLFSPAVVLIAVVLTGLLIWHPWSGDRAGPVPPSDKPSLAVMYFENNTGDDNLDHWRKGISDLLITDLTQSRYLKVLGGDRLVDILSQMDQLDARSYSSEVLNEVAAQGGVNHILRGSYSKAGDILRIDMVLQDAGSGEPIASQRVEGKGEEAIFTMVDELTRWTKESLRLTSEQIADDVDREIANVTTSSPEALKFYAEGIQFFNQQQERQSIAFFEKAIALDPEFAMAYRKMAIAYRNTGYRAESNNYMQKALELRDRLTDRERLLIEGSHYGSDRSTYDKAVEAYERLLSLYPESDEAITAHHNLGPLYQHLEEWDKAIAHTEAAIKAGSKTRNVYTNLASQYMGKGDYQKAENILKESIIRYPDFASAHWTLGRIYVFQGQFDLALAEADKAATINPTLTKAQFYHMMWNFEKAEEEYNKWFGFISPNDHLQARQRLSLLYQTLGRFEDAKHQILTGIDEARKQKHDLYLDQFHYELAYLSLFTGDVNDALEAMRKTLNVNDAGTLNKIYRLQLEGWIYAEMGRMDEAVQLAEEVKRLVDTNPLRAYLKEYHALKGLIELNRKNYPDAIESFKEAVSRLPHPEGFLSDNSLFLFCLAQAYEGSGDLKAARDEFEKTVAFIPGRIQCGGYHAKAYFRLGRIYEQLGDADKAIENYEKFLDLWKGADPGQPEVEDAKARLADLTSEQ